MPLSYFPRNPGVLAVPYSPRDGAILYVQSNCVEKRDAFVRSLMETLEVHSYGACVNNMEFPKGKTVRDLSREYRFVVTFENSEDVDYITEKALGAQSV